VADTDNDKLNGIDTATLREVMKAVSAEPSKGMVKFEVKSSWTGQCKMETEVASYTLGGQEIKRPHKIVIDEPHELLGTNQAPNPQEVLMAAFNSCIMVGYTMGAAMKGIKLEKLEVETEGELDLRGFLGLDASIKPGYETIRYKVHIKGDGSKEQFEEIHDTVCRTSPNRFNVAEQINLDAELIVEE